MRGHHLVDFVYWVVHYELVDRLGRWRSKSILRESLWVVRRMHNHIEQLVGSKQRRDCKLLLGRMGNIHSSVSSTAAEAVAADTEVAGAVELDIAAELAVSMVPALPGLVASAVSRVPWCLMYIVYSLDGVAVVRLTRLLMGRHSHVTNIKVQRGSSNRWRQGTFDNLIANRY